MSPSNLTSSPAPAGSDILIRGAAAAKAQPIDLVGSNPRPQTVDNVGPWAEQLNALHESARQQGFEQGRAEGRAKGLEEGRQQLDALLSSLGSSAQRLLSQLEARSEEMGQRLSDQTVDLALEIATAVLRREIESIDDPGAEAIARCLEMAPSTGDLFARLHPQDAAELGKIEGLADRGLMITPDTTLERGDAVVTINDATIDARIGESLRRVAEVLR